MSLVSKKVIVVGNSQSGKSFAISSLTGNAYDQTPTLGVEVHCFRINSSIYKIWDCAGHPQFLGLGVNYYSMAEIALVFEGGLPTKSLEQHIQEIRNVSPYCEINIISGGIYQRIYSMRDILI